MSVKLDLKKRKQQIKITRKGTQNDDNMRCELGFKFFPHVQEDNFTFRYLTGTRLC